MDDSMPAASERERQAYALERLHALSIAQAAYEIGSRPLLIGDPELLKLAVDLPCLAASGIRKLAAAFKIWRLGRKQEFQILALGSRSLKFARLLQRMSNSAPIYLYCPIVAPEPRHCRNLHWLRGCLCGSSFMEQIFADDFLKSKAGAPRLSLAPPGIDLEEYNHADRRESRHFIFGMAESLWPQSGALFVARAMSALWQQTGVPNWEVRMFGSGPRFGEIMAEAENLGVLPRLSLLGEQPLPEVAGHCDVWLAPGMTSEELPATLWAGCAAGLPVIARASRLHRQRLFNPSAALTVDSDNPQDMAKAMLKLLREPELCAELALTGVQMRPQISLEGMARRVLAILERPQETEQADRALA